MNIRIINARKKYENQEVLSVEELEFNEGYVYALMGLNGSGKTTLLQCISGLEQFTSGKVLYDDIEDVELVADKLAVMMQQPYLFNCSSLENIVMALKYRRISNEEINCRVEKFLKYFDIDHLLPKSIKKLSGGERERVALLRTAVLEAEITLLDEPTANMDIENTLKAEKLIRDLANDKRSVILVTHDLFQVERIADYVVVFDNGKVIEKGESKKVVYHQRERLLKQDTEGK